MTNWTACETCWAALTLPSASGSGRLPALKAKWSWTAFLEQPGKRTWPHARNVEKKLRRKTGPCGCWFRPKSVAPNSHLRGQGIELVNLGEASRVKQGELGHWICSVCGTAKTPYAVHAEISQFLRIHKERCGKEPTRLAQTVQADVDLLQFYSVKDESSAINIGEALRKAAT